MKRYDLIVVGAGPAGQRVCQNSGPFPLRRHPAEGERTFNGKSIVSVLSACVKCGTQVTIVCDGEQEEDALRTIVEAVESGLGE